MSSTPQHLLEILRRVSMGKHLGGGDVPHGGLQGDIDLLVALRMIDTCRRRSKLTDLGAQVLAAAQPVRRPRA